ncbi:MAG TPA: flagellar hook-associated protein FlgK [Pseudobdellovibrionaceae bacterium]|nr:flagellar hook-associated protein FlgK [Pseudobdellovibrionaceae bacterium]
MSKISAIMDISKRSLANSQTALQTVSHNIANKSTEGFSRQRVEIQANRPSSEGRLQIGTGSRAAAVTRTNNPWLEKQIQKEDMNLGYMDARAESLTRVEEVYNEQVNKGLNQYVSDFFNSFRELANNPESLASRTLVRENAVAMSKDFQRVVSQLQDIQVDLDGQIKTTVEEVNQQAKEIAQLNEKIKIVELNGIPANDERDRRDLLLKKMGEKMEISWAEGSDGMVTVSVGRTGLLVSGVSTAELKASYTGDRDRVEVFFIPGSDKQPINISRRIEGGRVGGALQVRDEVIEDMMDKVDQMAFAIGDTVNRIHMQGFDRKNKPGGVFFDIPSSKAGAAKAMNLNDEIYNDVGKIAAAAQLDAPGDNTIANVISALQYQKIMDDNSATIDDYWNSQVGKIGTIAQRANKSQESQKNVLGQLTNIRESISGVSLDEETTKMIEFQKTFDASAKLIRMADEMLDTVLNIRR